MAHRRFHYDRAFEHYLRANAIPYVAVDEAKRALHGRGGGLKLKSFDFVVYSERGDNLLIDVKGRKHAGNTGRSLQNWVTRDDVDCLKRWSAIFGKGFDPAFVFLFWCDAMPPDALFLEVYEFEQRWYSVLAVRVWEYEKFMKQRSAKWDTVAIPAEVFGRLSVPLKTLL